MTLPLVFVEGEPYEQGLQHGRALADRIAHNLAVYYDRFWREGRLGRDQARSRAATYRPLLEPHPYYAALRGLAAGSGELLDLLVLNLRYELLYYQYGVNGISGPDGCTAFAILPAGSVTGHLLLGQNWDWIPEVKGAVLHTREPDGLETLSFTEAGVLGGKIGCNSSGLGLTINGLMTTDDDWSRLVAPFHVRCYDILRCRTLEDARGVIADTPRACSANFLLAQAPDRAVDIETAPDTSRELGAGASRIVHTNHFLQPELLGVAEPLTERRPHSNQRQTRLEAILDARLPVGIGDLEVALRDHDDYPDSICRHENTADPPEEWCISVTSVIMDLDELALWLTDGPPCEHLYEGFSIRHPALLGR